MQQDDTKGKYGDPVLSGTLGGMVAGLVIGIWTLFYQRIIPDGGLDFLQITNIPGLLTSITFFCLAHSAFGFVVGMVFAFVFGLARRRPPFFLPASIAVGISVGFYAGVYVFVATNLDLPANISLGDPIRIAAIWRSLLYGAGIGIAVFIVGIPLFSRLRSRNMRLPLVITLVLMVGLLTYSLFRWNASAAHYESRVQDSVAEGDAPGKVIIVGIDGATWQILDRFSEEGLLPNFDRMRATGATANLVTHGRRLSPAVWTGIATGWSHAKHGIRGFMVPDPVSGIARSAESGDRLKPAVWQILSNFGKTSMVVNWYVGYPAEEINGTIVSRLVDLDEHSVYPPEFLPTVNTILKSAGIPAEGQDKAYAGVDAVFDFAETSIAGGQPDLILLYMPWTDWYQHVYWASFEPNEFGEDWAITDENLREGAERLRRLWSQIDGRVGRLVDAAEKGTSVIVISDHGFKPRAKITAFLRPNDLLQAMGYLEWAEDEPSVIDFENTRAFSSQPDTFEPVIGISLNVAGRQPTGIVPAGAEHSVARQVIKELSDLRIKETGEPLFLRVGLASEGAAELGQQQGFDIYAEQGAALRTGGSRRTVVIANKEHQLDDFLTITLNNTGNSMYEDSWELLIVP
ncbi:alkaline phosphatase family protein [Acidobacteriota bacterium]